MSRKYNKVNLSKARAYILKKTSLGISLTLKGVAEYCKNDYSSFKSALIKKGKLDEFKELVEKSRNNNKKPIQNTENATTTQEQIHTHNNDLDLEEVKSKSVKIFSMQLDILERGAKNQKEKTLISDKALKFTQNIFKEITAQESILERDLMKQRGKK